ncbi:MAG: hypothetical protein R2834_19470 [Rhodothermales bacterium]
MTQQQDIEAASGDPARLEQLYRSAREAGREADFREALRHCAEASPGDVLFEAWAHRLDVPVVKKEAAGGDRRWLPLIGGSVALGVLSALLAGGQPPVPAPGEATTLFWVSWGPMMALGLLAYLAWVQRAKENVTRYAVAAVAVVVLALYVGLVLSPRTGDVAELTAVHLPLLCWAIVGAALCFGYRDPERQAYGFLVKSVESVLTGGIFFGAGVLFIGLTVGIFKVLGIALPEEELVVVVAWGVGAIPLLAVGSAFDATRTPAAQDEQAGMARTLRILARLILPLALGVLVVYVLWFIPVYFLKAFEEREVLLVYNATIVAILVLLTVVVSGPLDAGRGSLLRYGVLALGALTLILNAYALAAVAGRALDAGLTPNRLAVIGWNVTTLLILSTVGLRLWKHRLQPWLPVFRASMGMVAGLAAVWGVLLLLLLPLFP